MKKKTLALFSAAVMAAAAMTGCSNNTAPTSPSTEETTKAPEAPSTEAVAEIGGRRAEERACYPRRKRRRADCGHPGGGGWD